MTPLASATSQSCPRDGLCSEPREEPSKRCQDCSGYTCVVAQRCRSEMDEGTHVDDEDYLLSDAKVSVESERAVERLKRLKRGRRR